MGKRWSMQWQDKGSTPSNGVTEGERREMKIAVVDRKGRTKSARRASPRADGRA
jgi:hypothetical protein